MNFITQQLKIVSKKNIVFALLLFIFLFPIMHFHIQSKILIAWVVVALIVFYKNIRFYKKDVKIYLINMAWIFWLLISISYSSNPSFGLSFFQKLIPLIIVPFIFFIIGPFSEKKKRLLLLTFAVATLLFAAYVFWYLHFRFYHLYRSIYVKKGTFHVVHYIRYTLNNLEYLYGHGGEKKFPLFFHKSYFSMSVLLTIHILLQEFLKVKRVRVIIFILVVFLAFILLKFDSLIHILLLLVTVPAVILFKFFDENLKKTIQILILCFVALSAFVFLQKELKEKVFSSINSRNIINNCSLPLAKEKPIFGFGLGGVQSKLTACYKEKLTKDKSYSYTYKGKHNTHNYYMNVYLSGGIIGLFLFLYMMYFVFKIAVNNNAILYFTFLVIFFGTLLVENVLSRSYGTLFFALLNSLFLQSSLNSETSL